MIQHIIAPTDFSENANKAVRAAINFAEDLDASVTILHTYTVPSSTGMLMSIEHMIYEEAQKEMTKLVNRLTNENLNMRLVKTDIIRDQVDIGVCHYSKRHNGDLIMMGNKGQSNVASVFFGSNARNLVQAAKVPVWIVSEVNPLPEKKGIIFAVDHHEQLDRVRTFPLIEIARNYQSPIHFLKVDTDDSVKADLVEVPLSFKGLETTSTVVESEHIIQSIEQFAEEKDVDMICLIYKKRNWWKSLFTDSIIDENLFNKPHFNVLVLKEKFKRES
jgi:nucleotide-binding universal stress UspA family protein